MQLSKSLELGLAALTSGVPGRGENTKKRRAGGEPAARGGRGWRGTVHGPVWDGEGRKIAGERRDKEEARVVKPRLQIYDIELEVRRTLEAGLIKFDDRELRNENETRRVPEPREDGSRNSLRRAEREPINRL